MVHTAEGNQKSDEVWQAAEDAKPRLARK